MRLAAQCVATQWRPAFGSIATSSVCTRTFASDHMPSSATDMLHLHAIPTECRPPERASQRAARSCGEQPSGSAPCATAHCPADAALDTSAAFFRAPSIERTGRETSARSHSSCGRPHVGHLPNGATNSRGGHPLVGAAFTHSKACHLRE